MTGWKTRQGNVERLAGLEGQERRKAIRDLVESMRHHSENLDDLNTAVEALSRLGDEAVPPLLELLGPGEAETRIAAVLTLGQVGSHAAVDPLLGLLGDDDPNVRYHSVEALGRIRSRAAVPALLEVLTGGDFFLLFICLDALGAIGEPAALPELVALLADDLLATEALETLGRCRHQLALGPVGHLLEEALPDAIPAIVVAYERIVRAYDSRPGLSSELLEEFGERLSADFATLLPELEPPSSLEDRRLFLQGSVRLVGGWLQRGILAPAEAMQALTLLLSLAIEGEPFAMPPFPLGLLPAPALGNLLHSSEVPTRLLLIGLLGNQLGTGTEEDTTGHLLQLLRDPDLEVRQAAARALTKVPSRGLSLDDLLPFAGASDTDVIDAVLTVAENLLTGPIDAQVWETILDHPDPATRRLAARAARSDRSQALAGWLHDRLRVENDDLVLAALVETCLLGRISIDEWLLLSWDTLGATVTALVAEHLDLLPVTTVEAVLERALATTYPFWTRLHTARSCAENAALSLLVSTSTLDRLLQDPVPPVRASALVLLARNPSTAVDEQLAGHLQDSEQDIVRGALRGLGLRDSVKASALLWDAFERDPKEVLSSLPDDFGTAALRLLEAALSEADLSGRAAHLLWRSEQPDAPVILVRGVLASGSSQHLRPPAGASSDTIAAVSSALERTPWPEVALEQMAWLEAAGELSALHLLPPGGIDLEELTPWARRSLLLILFDRDRAKALDLARAWRSDHDPDGEPMAALILGDPDLGPE